MRAHWLSNLEDLEEYTLKGDELHHLLNVVRIEAGEKLLLLDGHGLKVQTEVISATKKAMQLKRLNAYQCEREYVFDLALGMPKREALELCLKEATELGFRRIFLIKSDYSQMRFPEEERIQKLLISALEQSNAAFLPEVIHTDWENVPWDSYQVCLMLDSQVQKVSGSDVLNFSGPQMLVVGPEGGFSPDEAIYLHSRINIQVVNLPTPILRTPTAVAAGAGLMLQRLLK